MIVTVLNPNSTQAMTDAVVAQLRHRLRPGVQLRGVTAADGPPVIASRATFATAAAMAPRFAAEAGDVLLLACFGDPGLEALRHAAAPRRVVGLAEAAVAATAGRRFAIVTAGSAWVGLLNERVADFGAADRLTGVHALAIDGRQLAADPQACRGALRDAARAAEDEGAECLVLGGAAFAGLAHLVETRLPRIDPIDAAAAALASG